MPLREDTDNICQDVLGTRWVMYVEKSICDVDSKLVLHHDTLKKLKRRLEIMQQMHNAPSLYCSAIVEVVRRRSFSRHFIQVGRA